MNILCENKFVGIVNKAMALSDGDGDDQMSTQSNIQTYTDYQSVKAHLTVSLLQDNSSAVLCSELKLFVRVRSNCNVKRGKIQYPDIPNTKQSLLLKCLELKDTPV